jgi:lipoate-protein ligase A
MYNGTFEPTAVVFHWDAEQPTVTLGAHDNADLIDHDRVDELDLPFFRRYAQPGGAGIHIPETPLVQLWYRDDSTLKTAIDEVGEAFNEALVDLGLETEYRPIGDLEILVGGDRFKVGATGAGRIHFDDYVTTTASLIWGATDDFGLLDEVLTPPPEKFEDKDTDDLASRMRPLETLLGEIGVDVSKGEIVDGMVEEFASRVVGDDEVVETDWRPEEAAFLDEASGFFSTDNWTFRKSSRRLATHAPGSHEIGIAGYKSRKTLQATVIVDGDGLIGDVELTGDLYIRPQHTISDIGAMEEMERAITGLDPTDGQSLETAITDAFAEHDIEAPGIEPEHFVEPVLRAAETTQPVDQYLAEQ